MPKKAQLEVTESVGKVLQERKKAEPTEADYRAKYESVQAGHLTQRQAAKELGTSKGDVYRKFKKFETESGAHKETQEAESTTLGAEPTPQREGWTPQPDIAGMSIIEGSIGIQYLGPHKLDNVRYQPRAVIAAGDDLVHDIEFRGGNVYAVLVQQSTLAVIDGHRRVDAIIRINTEHPKKKPLLVKCDVQDLTDQQAALLAYQANVLSSPLSEGERDKWIYSLMSVYNLTTKQIHDETGLAESRINNIRRGFEKTTSAVKERLESGKIKTGVAIAVAALEPTQQTRLVKKAESKGLSEQQVEDEVKEIKGRETAREALYKHLVSKKLENAKIELKQSKSSYGNPVYQWCDNILKEVYGGSYHREGGRLVETNDVKAAAKRAGIEFSIKPEPIILCEMCPWNRHQKCGFNLKGYPKRKKCEKYIPPVPMGFGSRFDYTFCDVCGGFLNGIDDSLHSQGTHDVCLIKARVSKGALSGLCETCGKACELIELPFEFLYNADDTLRRKVHIDICGDHEAQPDLAAMNKGALERVERLIAKHQETAEIAEKNHSLAEANEAKQEIVGNIGIELTESIDEVKAKTAEGGMKPKSPARFTEDPDQPRFKLQDEALKETASGGSH